MKLGTGAIPWNNLGYFLNDPATATDLNNEILDRINADNVLQNQIDTLTDNLATEYTNRTTADLNLQAQINILETNLSNEVDRAEGAEDTLTNDLVNEVNNRISDVSGLLYNIETVEDNLNIEIDDRISGIYYLENGIDTLTTNLNGEVNNRISDVSGLQYEIDILETDLTTEINDRISDVSGLQYEIDTVNENLDNETNNRILAVSGALYDIDVLRTDLTAEVNNRISGVSGAIYISSEDATNKANTAESNAKEYADDLALATQKWFPAVQTFDDLPANPGDGTYLCRVITGDDYGVYQWIGTETTPEWTYFSDNLDFIDRIANPVTDNIPIITANGELIDGGQSISGITSVCL
jgi:hypothetical protein